MKNRAATELLSLAAVADWRVSPAVSGVALMRPCRLLQTAQLISFTPVTPPLPRQWRHQAVLRGTIHVGQ